MSWLLARAEQEEAAARERLNDLRTQVQALQDDIAQIEKQIERLVISFRPRVGRSGAAESAARRRGSRERPRNHQVARAALSVIEYAHARGRRAVIACCLFVVADMAVTAGSSRVKDRRCPILLEEAGYKPIRAHNEGLNGRLKGHAVDLSDPKNRLAHGRAAQTILVALMTMIANLQILAAWWRTRQPPGPIPDTTTRAPAGQPTAMPSQRGRPPPANR